MPAARFASGARFTGRILCPRSSQTKWRRPDGALPSPLAPSSRPRRAGRPLLARLTLDTRTSLSLSLFVADRSALESLAANSHALEQQRTATLTQKPHEKQDDWHRVKACAPTADTAAHSSVSLTHVLSCHTCGLAGCLLCAQEQPD